MKYEAKYLITSSTNTIYTENIKIIIFSIFIKAEARRREEGTT